MESNYIITNEMAFNKSVKAATNLIALHKDTLMNTLGPKLFKEKTASFRVGYFYGLPKAHKNVTTPPMRPVVSQINHPTAIFSYAINNFLKSSAASTTTTSSSTVKISESSHETMEKPERLTTHKTDNNDKSKADPKDMKGIDEALRCRNWGKIFKNRTATISHSKTCIVIRKTRGPSLINPKLTPNSNSYLRRSPQDATISCKILVDGERDNVMCVKISNSVPPVSNMVSNSNTNSIPKKEVNTDHSSSSEHSNSNPRVINISTSFGR